MNEHILSGRADAPIPTEADIRLGRVMAYVVLSLVAVLLGTRVALLVMWLAKTGLLPGVLMLLALLVFWLFMAIMAIRLAAGLLDCLCCRRH